MNSVNARSRKIAATVEIALPRRVGMVHHPLVFRPALETTRETSGDRPKSMCANACGVRHRVTHQSADTSVAVRKRMDVVEAMMCGRDRNDAGCFAHARETIPFRKMRHEVLDAVARRRDVSADGHIVLRMRAPRTGYHREIPALAAYPKHLLRGVAIEFAVQPADEVDRGRLGQLVFAGHPIDFGLDLHMRCCFDLQVAALLALVELAGKRALDVPWSGVVAFNQIAVVGVHDPHELGEVCRRARVKAAAEFRRGRREFGDCIGYCLGIALQAVRVRSDQAFPGAFLADLLSS